MHGLLSREGGEPEAADPADKFGRELMQASIHWANCHLTLIVLEDFEAREAWIQITATSHPSSVTLSK